MPRRFLMLAVAAALALSACGGDDSSSGNTLPQASEADLAAAQVSGPWTVTITIDTQEPPVLDDSIALGDVLERHFVLGNGCNVDTSDCNVNRESAAGQSSETWTRQGANLNYHVEAPVTLECEVEGTDTEVEYAVQATITLTVTDAVQLGDAWTATEMAYAREAELVPTTEGCPTGTQTESGTAVPGTTVPDTTVPDTTD